MYVDSDELTELHREFERTSNKLDLRLERLEDYLSSQRGQINAKPHDFATRKDFEQHLDAFDNLAAAVKLLSVKVTKLFESIEMLALADD